MPNRKKVLILLPVFNLGGAEKQGLYIADSLQKTGKYEVEVWALQNGGEMLKVRLEECGLKYKNLDIPFSAFESRSGRLKAYWKYLNELRKANIDILIPFTYHCNVMSASVFRLAGVKKCIWFQIAMEYHIPMGTFEKLALNRKPIYAANSRAAGDFIANKHGIDPKSVSFIPNPFEPVPAKYTAENWRQKLGMKSSDVLMVMAANFFPEKDHITLLKGLNILLPDYPNLKLIFAGGLQPETASNAVKAAAFDLGLCNHVHFIGSTDDVPGLLNAAQVGILSSRSEGSPNALIEYMGYGIPVIATDIPAISELLGKDYPYLFEVENVDDFVQKTQQLLSRSNTKLVEKNQAIIAETYTVSTNLNAFLNLIEA